MLSYRFGDSGKYLPTYLSYLGGQIVFPHAQALAKEESFFFFASPSPTDRIYPLLIV